MNLVLASFFLLIASCTRLPLLSHLSAANGNPLDWEQSPTSGYYGDAPGNYLKSQVIREETPRFGKYEDPNFGIPGTGGKEESSTQAMDASPLSGDKKTSFNFKSDVPR